MNILVKFLVEPGIYLMNKAALWYFTFVESCFSHLIFLQN